MGCSPSTLPPAPSAGQTGERGSLPLDASEKDESRLFCIKLRRSRLRRCSCGGVTLQPPSDGNGSTAGDNLCGQVLLNPLQTKSEADYEKVTQCARPEPPYSRCSLLVFHQLSTGKKDSIVTVAALGNFTHSVVRRATGSK